MKASVTRIRDLNAVLKDLEPHVKSPDFLWKGREFKNFALRPREVLANILICVAGNFDDPNNRLTVCTDPAGGDGLIQNQRHGGYMTTEHILIPSNVGNAESLEGRIVAAIEHKKKKGATYCRGKDLVIFSNHAGIWVPNDAAKRIVGRHEFETVWVVHLEKGGEQGYSYCVCWLDARGGNAPCWRISIDKDFRSWQAERVQ